VLLQRIGIGRFQLGKLAIVENLLRQVVAGLGQLFEKRRGRLSRLSGDFSQILARLEEEIQEDAGERFQVSSPKQIGDVLFGNPSAPAPAPADAPASRRPSPGARRRDAASSSATGVR
jgi:hypothetical protein